MKKVLLTLVAIAAIGMASAQEKNYIDMNYIEVNGYASMEVEPDMIYMQITLNESDLKGKISMPELEKSMVSALEKVGVNVKKDLTLNDASSFFRKKTDAMLSKNYGLLVHNVQMVGKVILALEDSGISNVSIVKTDNSNIEELKMKIKVEAVKNAQTSAATLATAIGQTAGRAIYIYDNNNSMYRSQYQNFASKRMVMDAAGIESSYVPDVEFRKNEINASVLVKFELK